MIETRRLKNVVIFIQTLLRNIYFAIFNSHLNYSCIVWVQNINTVKRLIILQKKALRIMHFKHQLFHSSPLSSLNNILKFGDRITLENIVFVRKCINRQVPSIFYDWFTFSGNLHSYETCWSVTNHLNIPTFRSPKYDHFGKRASAIRSWNYAQDMLKINLLLKNSALKSIKYFLSILLKVTNNFCTLDHNLQGVYQFIHIY